ncbi:SdpA family antimicrobial peptide system protein [Bacillus stercoris]|uniref:SdpA family antimicrobial peptide system protein n=1 Tax=Bacillus stercoris TaxID=2054641 RepID=UPI002DB805CC|nr:SdpA family antimicrobial peptide system protein [Bacillus stercoris]MEC3616772.1 SdpA family antimicrobial peptide system protein [Bacillus stercoris]
MQKSISFFVIFSVLWGSIFLFSIIGSLGTTPIPLTKDSKFLMSSILPQGWGFFSKNPRDTSIGLYEAEDASAKVRWPNMRADNLFGLYRYGRSQGVEMGVIYSQVGKEQWTACKEKNLGACKSKAKTVQLKTPAPRPLLCGSYYLTKEDIVPWSYSKYTPSSYQVKSIVKVVISCSKT